MRVSRFNPLTAMPTLALLSALLIVLSIAVACQAQTEHTASLHPTLKSIPLPEKSYDQSTPKLYGQVDLLLSHVEAAGLILSSKVLPARIEMVRLGTPAFYANLAKSDKVLSAEIAENKLVLKIERGGRRYAATIDTNPTSGRIPLQAKETLQTSRLGNDPTLESNVKETEIRVMSIHDLFDWYDAIVLHKPDRFRASDFSQHPQEWQQWKLAVYDELRRLASKSGLKGWGGLHMLIDRNGHVLETGEYDATDKDRVERDKTGTSRLQALLKSTSLKEFPAASKLQTIHIVFRPVGSEYQIPVHPDMRPLLRSY